MRTSRPIIFAAVAGAALWSQAPCAQGVACPTPAPEKQADGQGAYAVQAPRPLPVEIVESSEKAIASKRAEAESREHDARDLDAQIRAADAAEKQIFPAWVSAILSALGTGLLVWTLLETRKSGAAAESAAQSARDALHSERAWLMQSGINWGEATNFRINDEFHQSGFVYRLAFQNAGRSPATHVFVATASQTTSADQADVPTFTLSTSFEMAAR